MTVKMGIIFSQNAIETFEIPFRQSEIRADKGAKNGCLLYKRKTGCAIPPFAAFALKFMQG